MHFITAYNYYISAPPVCTEIQPLHIVMNGYERNDHVNFHTNLKSNQISRLNLLIVHVQIVQIPKKIQHFVSSFTVRYLKSFIRYSFDNKVRIG